MRKEIIYKFGTITLYDNYLVTVINEGEHIVPEQSQLLADIAKEHYNNKPFVYITYRKYSYSVDPSIYLEVSKIKNLKGFAVIPEALVSKGNATVERMFLDKPFEIFETLEEAISWAKSMV